MRTNSLAARVFITSALWTLLALTIAGFIINRIYHDSLQASLDERLQSLVDVMSVESLNVEREAAAEPSSSFEPLFESTHSGWYWQVKPVDGASGPTLVSASLATARLPSPYEAGAEPGAGGRYWSRGVGPGGEAIRMVEVIQNLGFNPGRPRYSVIIARPIDWFEESLTRFRDRLAAALAVAGLGLVVATWFQVHFALLPLRKVEQGLAAIRSGDAVRLEGEIPTEIEPLRVELNALIQSNQDIVERARTQVGNLAHALKTPLAVIVNEAQREKTGFGAKVAEQARIMRDQVGHYLDRARMAARAGAIGRVTPIAATVEALVRALEHIYGEKGVAITVACPPQARFAGEKQDLEEMLGGLLDNACKWSHSSVYLKVEPLAFTEPFAGPRVAIEIEDDGAGLSEEHLARLGTRGTRLDETVPGSGLGLSIVKDLAQSYRGTLSLVRSRYGGLMARLELPSAQ